MSRPGLSGVLLGLHESVDGPCGAFGTTGVDEDVDGVAVDVFCGGEDAG